MPASVVPALDPWTRISSSGNGSLGNIAAQHEELAMDPRSTPSRILRHHAVDQFPDLLRDPPSANLTSHLRDHAPVHAKAGTMPANHRLRSNEDEGLLPGKQQRRADTQKSLSSALSLGLGCLRFRTVSCCRSTKFSMINPRRERRQRTSSPNHSRKKRTMGNSHTKSAD
jgi:hypothetical protein